MRERNWCINPEFGVRHHTNLFQVCAIECAVGCHLPNTWTAWPLGLLARWNELVTEDDISECQTINDFARAYLARRVRELDIIAEHFNKLPEAAE